MQSNDTELGIGTLFADATYNQVKIDPEGTTWLACEPMEAVNGKTELFINTEMSDTAQKGDTATIVFQELTPEGWIIGTLGVIVVVLDYGSEPAPGEGAGGESSATDAF